MIEISNTAAPLLIQALKGAVKYNEQLLKSETLKDRSKYDKYFVDVTQFYCKRSINPRLVEL